MAGAEEILDGLDEQQRQAALAVQGPLLILAGAGSGKTRTITHRIAYASAIGAQRPDRALAVTFTAKAAGQMRARLAALGVAQVAVSTFHAAALRQLRHFWPIAVGGPVPKLVSAKAQYLAEAMSSLGLPRDRVLLRDLAAEIEWAKVSRIRRDEYAASAQHAGRTPPGGLTHAEVAAGYGAYAELLSARGLMDFEDVLQLTVALLQDRPDIADQVRQRYRWITVDEYQDVSAVQQALLQAWLGESDQICVVGDPGQTIYTFAGASARYLQDFTTWQPRAAVVPLPRTYRCSPQIVAAANGLLAADGRRSGHVLRLTSQQPPGSPVAVRPAADDIAEAEAVAAQVKAWRGAGVPLREIAVLVRINAATAPIEDALADAGIAYVVTGGERFFTRPHVREAVIRLRGAAKAGGPGRLTEAVAEVFAAMGFVLADPPAGRGAARERWESLAALSAMAADLSEQRPDATLADLVAEIDRRATTEAEPAADAVTLATMHAAKGLEWDAVWIAGMQEGTVPISYADTVDRVEEERRLCYVAITRARRELVISWAAARGGDHAGTRVPSRFLRDLSGRQTVVGELPQARSGARAAARRTAPGTGLGRCRICGKGLPTPRERALQRCRTCPEQVDLALLERLLRWRAEQVAATGAPAYTVFTDLTLRAIAELQPHSSQELLGITGVGEAKAGRFGAAVLAMVAAAGSEPAADGSDRAKQRIDQAEVADQA